MAFGTGGHGKPALGSWESSKLKPIDPYARGMFLARPGVYYPMHPTVDVFKDVRGRGVGKQVILDHWQDIIRKYEEHPPEAWNLPARGEGEPKPRPRTIQVTNVTRFCGAKASISRGGNEREGFRYTRASGVSGVVGHDKVAYGQWIGRPVDLSLSPMPKREKILGNGQLLIRKLPRDVLSAPYKKAVVSPDARLMIAAKLEALEQPDGDFVFY